MKYQTLQYWIKLPVLKKILWPRIFNFFSFSVSFNEIFNPRCGFLEEKYYFPSGTLCCYLSWIMRGLILSQTPALLSQHLSSRTNKTGNIALFSSFFWLFLFFFSFFIFLMTFFSFESTAWCVKNKTFRIFWKLFKRIWDKSFCSLTNRKTLKLWLYKLKIFLHSFQGVQ